MSAVRILVTGATGYIGAACATGLQRAGHDVLRGARIAPVEHCHFKWLTHGDLTEARCWEDTLSGIDVVVHCAGLAQVRDDVDGAKRAIAVNVEGTGRLARVCVAAGVKRLILISSALVMGSVSAHGAPYTDRSQPAPCTAYARSKLESERVLRETAEAGNMGWVVLRPPMVYGPRSRGNFLRLLRLVERGVPLPLAKATQPKSIIAIDNLVSAVGTVATHPYADGSCYLIADAEVTSTAGLVQQIAAVLGRPLRMFAVPAPLLKFGGRVLGLQREMTSLLDPMQIDISGIRQELGWKPPMTQSEAIAEAVSWCSPSNSR